MPGSVLTWCACPGHVYVAYCDVFCVLLIAAPVPLVISIVIVWLPALVVSKRKPSLNSERFACELWRSRSAGTFLLRK